jgi:preprotein translocase subunit SecA
MLQRRGVKHEVLNAKHHAREADIIAQAGRKAAVTIATNMAGRGTDIILGGNPENMAWSQLQTKYATRLDVPKEEWDSLVKEIEEREHMKTVGREVATMGGLHVIGTERHEARRIDLQLMGRCGRQGDPGSSRFYLSLDDDLMRIFAGEWVKNILSRLGMQEGEAIESRMVSRRIEAAQKKVEERNFETRKHLLEYDEVMDEQRKRVYGYRQRILDGAKCKDLVLEMIDKQIHHHMGIFLNPNFGAEEFALFAGKQLGVQLEPRDFKNLSFDAADTLARDEAERQAEGQVLEALEENLPEDAEEPEHEWNWEALARWANTRWGLNLRDKDLKKSGREQVGEILLERAREAIGRIDLKSGEQYLADTWGKQTACDWVDHKFAVKLPLDEILPLDAAAIEELVKEKAREAYEEREVEFPVLAGLYGCSTQDGQGHRRYDREQLVNWARQRFNVTLDVEDLKNKQGDEVQSLLMEHSRQSLKQADLALAKVQDKLAAVFGSTATADRSDTTVAIATGGNGALESLTQWIERDLEHQVSADDLKNLTREQLRVRLEGYVDDRYRPEIRRMEREVVLQLLDSAWKDHLLAMDHLRSGIGLMSYAQVDPKVEYKREGMRIFEVMWQGFGDRVTNLVFRMEQLDENFVGSIWKESAARKEAIELPGANAPGGEITEQQEAAIQAGESQAKPEPIRNRQEKVGRNDPCPCGSGKKFKNCHMKQR